MKPRILVIDDDRHVGNALRRLLQVEGFEVIAVDNGADGIRIIGTGLIFDLILCDQGMPDLTGDQVFDTMVEIQSWVRDRFVLMTGGWPTREGMKVIQKPFDLDVIKQIARMITVVIPKE